MDKEKVGKSQKAHDSQCPLKCKVFTEEARREFKNDIKFNIASADMDIQIISTESLIEKPQRTSH